jgi:RimJ/RimL family protein N-acetyltransferase
MGIADPPPPDLSGAAARIPHADLRRMLQSLPAPGLRRALLDDALQRAHEATPGERLDWLQTLRALADDVRDFVPVDVEPLIALAAAWADWPLVRRLALRLGDAHALSVAVETALLQALHRVGATTEAIARCRSRMLSHPFESAVAGMHAHLLAWQRFVEAVGGGIDGEDIRLEPLGHHHLQDFALQYADPQIAALCCLPAFRDDRRWHAWLDGCWRCGDEWLYAVIHREWGFVGSVSLCRHRDLGFFYYWIGRDFRGARIGPAAVRLLLQDACDRLGLRACYAKVFADNFPSRRALGRLGFAPLDVRAAPPDEREMFYRWGEAVDREVDVFALRRLFSGIGSGIRIAVPIVEPEVRTRAAAASRAAADAHG